MRRLCALEVAGLRGVGQLASPGGSRSSLIVLIYHRVLPALDPLLEGEPDATTFAAQMDAIKSLCNVLPLGEAVARLHRGGLPPRALCITFDDGYENNRSIAAPILHARGLPATVFVATGYIDNAHRMFNDTVIESVRHAPQSIDLTTLGLPRFELHDVTARVHAIEAILGALKYFEPARRAAQAEAIAEHVGAALPNNLMMSEQQIRELAGYGIDVGAHTMMHPILRSIDADQARREIAGSKETLEAIAGRRIGLFAYPNGRPGRDYDATHVALVKSCGFDAAVSTAWGAASRNVDMYQIPRMLPWDRSAFKFAMRLLRTYREQRPEQLAAS